jgi:hypothetical protein
MAEYMNADRAMILLGEAVEENITGALKIINSDHAQHHLGNGYKAYLDFTNLAAAGTLSYCFTTAAGNYDHMKSIDLSVLGSSCKVEILIDADVTVNTGTAIALNNTNHNTAKTANSTFKATPTYTGGTAWHQIQVLADSTAQNNVTTKSSVNENDELVLKPDTEYILKITNIGTDPITRGFLSMFFYEEVSGIDE